MTLSMYVVSNLLASMNIVAITLDTAFEKVKMVDGTHFMRNDNKYDWPDHWTNTHLNICEFASTLPPWCWREIWHKKDKVPV